MRALALRAHYGQPLEVDLCESCRLVWFDGLESVQLSGPSWIELLLALEDRDSPMSLPAIERLGCPRCSKPLGESFNQTRWGRFRSHGCPAGHGWLQPQTQLLSERGLLRPPTRGERVAMAAEHRPWNCLNCGAPTAGDGAGCAHCGTPLLLFDLPRLAASLQGREGRGNAGALAGRPAAGAAAPRLHAWACHACGSPMDPTVDPRCGQCDHPALAARFDDLRPLLRALRQAARAQARQPAVAPDRPRRRPLNTTFGHLMHVFRRDEWIDRLPTARWVASAVASGLLLLFWWLFGA